MSTFDIKLSKGLTLGLLVGMMPVGGIFGSLGNPFLVKHVTRRNIHYFVCLGSVLSTVLMQITNFSCIMIGRFVIGLTGCVYTMIGPQYIRELVPPTLRPLFGSFFSLGRVAGTVISYLLGLIFEVTNTP